MFQLFVSIYALNGLGGGLAYVIKMCSLCNKDNDLFPDVKGKKWHTTTIKDNVPTTSLNRWLDNNTNNAITINVERASQLSFCIGIADSKPAWGVLTRSKKVDTTAAYVLP